MTIEERERGTMKMKQDITGAKKDTALRYVKKFFLYVGNFIIIYNHILSIDNLVKYKTRLLTKYKSFNFRGWNSFKKIVDSA